MQCFKENVVFMLKNAILGPKKSKYKLTVLINW